MNAIIFSSSLLEEAEQVVEEMVASGRMHATVPLSKSTLDIGNDRDSFAFVFCQIKVNEQTFFLGCQKQPLQDE